LPEITSLIFDSATSLSWKQKILFPHPVSQSTKNLNEGIVAFQLPSTNVKKFPKSEGSSQTIFYDRYYLNKRALWSYKFQISIPAANYNTDQLMKGLGFRLLAVDLRN